MLRLSLAFILVSILFIPLSGCIEQFDIETERTAGILVINGRITNAVGPHKVTITRTAKKNRVSLPEGGALVSLLDDRGNNFDFFQETPGNYILPEGYASIFPGISYQLRVELNGNIYTSPLTEMSNILSKDSISYQFEDDVIINELGNELTIPKYKIYLRSLTPFADQKQYFKWEAREVFTLITGTPLDPPCFLTNRIDPQRIVIGESIEGNELILDGVLLASKNVDDGFSIKHYTLVSQFNITEDEYAYWKNVRSSIEQVGSIFDIPPARIRGNITNLNDPNEVVYGYFSVAAEKTVRYFILREDVQKPITFSCRRNFFIRPAFCFCEGGVARPSYF